MNSTARPISNFSAGDSSSSSGLGHGLAYRPPGNSPLLSPLIPVDKLSRASQLFLGSAAANASHQAGAGFVSGASYSFKNSFRIRTDGAVGFWRTHELVKF